MCSTLLATRVSQKRVIFYNGFLEVAHSESGTNRVTTRVHAISSSYTQEEDLFRTLIWTTPFYVVDDEYVEQGGCRGDHKLQEEKWYHIKSM